MNAKNKNTKLVKVIGGRINPIELEKEINEEITNQLEIGYVLKDIKYSTIERYGVMIHNVIIIFDHIDNI